MMPIIVDLKDAVEKIGQILDEERFAPTVRYEMAEQPPIVNLSAAALNPLNERGRHPRTVQEHPEKFRFKSTNFDLLCAVLDQVSEQDKPALFSASLSRTSDRGSYRHMGREILGAGQWRRCSSELPLVSEFVVRRGEKHRFINALSRAIPSPGLTLLLIQVEEMIALNFTLFTDEEYTLIRTAINGISGTIADLRKYTRASSTIESNVIYNTCKEVPQICASVVEACRKASFLYLKGSLLPGMNLEVNQDKNTVRTFLEKLGFAPLLIQSLDEAERLYRTAATPFDLKSSLGHLRSFLEQLHIQACAAAHKRFGGSSPSKWGEALKYLLDNAVLTKPEEQFASTFYTLMSDTTVHPLIAEREYARLLRNMSIEYGLLLLTKLDKLGLS